MGVEVGEPEAALLVGLAVGVGALEQLAHVNRITNSPNLKA